MRQGSLRSRPDVPEGTALWPAGFAGWIRVGVVYARTSHHMAELLKPLDLTVAQFDALAHLFVEDGITQQELAERLLVTKGNVTGLVNRLALRGLAERREDPEDRRANRIVLTRSGRSLAKRALTTQAALVRDMMGRLSAREQTALAQLLGRLADYFD
jgi:DNA-binding MarR family transcriptional regulator